MVCHRRYSLRQLLANAAIAASRVGLYPSKHRERPINRRPLSNEHSPRSTVSNHQVAPNLNQSAFRRRRKRSQPDHALFSPLLPDIF
jgi:hypothetical protein